MDQDPLLLAVVEPHLDEVVHPSPPQFRLAHDLPQFLVQGLVSAAQSISAWASGKNKARNGWKYLPRASFQGLS